MCLTACVGNTTPTETTEPTTEPQATTEPEVTTEPEESTEPTEPVWQQVPLDTAYPARMDIGFAQDDDEWGDYYVALVTTDIPARQLATHTEYVEMGRFLSEYVHFDPDSTLALYLTLSNIYVGQTPFSYPNLIEDATHIMRDRKEDGTVWKESIFVHYPDGILSERLDVYVSWDKPLMEQYAKEGKGLCLYIDSSSLD